MRGVIFLNIMPKERLFKNVTYEKHLKVMRKLPMLGIQKQRISCCENTQNQDPETETYLLHVRHITARI